MYPDVSEVNAKVKSLASEKDEEPLWLEGKLVEGTELSSEEDP